MNLQTDKVKVSNTGEGVQEVLKLAENFAATLNLNNKNSLQLRLLAEETISMLKAVTKDFQADLWFEQENNICKLYVEGKSSNLDYGKRKNILELSSTGENTEHLGIMEKVREIFEAGMYGLEESFKLQNETGAGNFNYGALGMLDAGMSEAVYAWSMQKYKDELNTVRENNENNQDQDSELNEAADELEKSIIANIADDVQVGITRDSVKLVITKKF